MIENIEKQVYKLIENDKTGHDINHIKRVKNLAIKFASQYNVDINTIVIACLLHDVDDYKIVDINKSKTMSNAKTIMNNANVDKLMQKKVLDIIKTIGYSNYLKGIKPNSIEGKIVFDADICDAIGAIGIIRSIIYTTSEKGSGIIFDEDILPRIDIDYLNYVNKNNNETMINHCFEKLLKLNKLLYTKQAIEEGNKRTKFLISFLKEFFYEIDNDKWKKLYNNYINKL